MYSQLSLEAPDRCQLQSSTRAAPQCLYRRIYISQQTRIYRPPHTHTYPCMQRWNACVSEQTYRTLVSSWCWLQGPQSMRLRLLPRRGPPRGPPAIRRTIWEAMSLGLPGWAQRLRGFHSLQHQESRDGTPFLLPAPYSQGAPVRLVAAGSPPKSPHSIALLRATGKPGGPLQGDPRGSRVLRLLRRGPPSRRKVRRGASGGPFLRHCRLQAGLLLQLQQLEHSLPQANRKVRRGPRGPPWGAHLP